MPTPIQTEFVETCIDILPANVIMVGIELFISKIHDGNVDDDVMVTPFWSVQELVKMGDFECDEEIFNELCNALMAHCLYKMFKKVGMDINSIDSEFVHSMYEKLSPKYNVAYDTLLNKYRSAKPSYKVDQMIKIHLMLPVYAAHNLNQTDNTTH